VEIQRRLNEQKWPDGIDKWKGDEDSNPGMWNGLRVRIGMHYCQIIDPKVDSITGRYDYYGHDVNVSARVESTADGGQIMMDADTYEQLLSDPDYPSISDDVRVVCYCREVELKGVAGTVKMYSATPPELSERVFTKKIEGATMMDTEIDREASSSVLVDNPSQEFSNSQRSNHSAVKTPNSFATTPAGRTVKDLLAVFPTDERNRLTDAVIQFYHLEVAKPGEHRPPTIARKITAIQKFMSAVNVGENTHQASFLQRRKSLHSQRNSAFGSFGATSNLVASTVVEKYRADTSLLVTSPSLVAADSGLVLPAV
jgi:hypothetical protein